MSHLHLIPLIGDGVQATQQIRVLEKEHASAVKGPVPRLPLVAVSADIQETAKKACLNSGMERYVTKPLMQKDLVAIVRHFCVNGDAEANTLAFTPPPEIPTSLGVTLPATVEAMVSAGHVAAPIGCGSGVIFSVTSSPTASVIAGGEKTLQKPSPKRELELSPAQQRGLDKIRETTLQDESSKVGGGGSIKSMNLALPIVASSSPMSSPASAFTSVTAPSIIAGITMGSTSLPPPMPGSLPMQHNGHYRLSTTHAMTAPTLRSAPIIPLNKASSSPALSVSYQAGLTSSPLPQLPPVQPVVGMAGSQGLTTAGTMASSVFSPTSPTSTSHLPGPIAAMAAGAAAAAVAVVSAIHEHIPHPSIYAAQGPLTNGSGNMYSAWTSLIGNGPSIHPTHQQQVQQHVQQGQDLGLVLQPSQDQHQQAPPFQPQPHPAQEVFVPYLQARVPLLTTEQQRDVMSAGPGNVVLSGKPSPVTITVTIPESVPEPLLPSAILPGALDTAEVGVGLGTGTGTGAKLPPAPVQLRTWL